MEKNICDKKCTCGCQEDQECICETENECTCGCEEGNCTCDENCTYGCQDKEYKCTCAE